ncbi:polysaccharide biosynthesis tyrosine autokinase [Myxosarcina sp. GI1]|uniref:GumC family protein n=1 Tax=Myxosarcina sp. GI1 TaxID=1541065 RepID=UPI0005674E5B|nr:polysaccharide biosynthesis tyrosine autokinase [Myxosarcina sp. GI1]
MERVNWEEERGDLGYGKLLQILWRRRYWFAGVFGTVLAVAIPLTLSKAPSYESYMQLLVEPNYQGNSNTRDAEQTFADSDIQIDYATQLNLMRSSELIQQAVEKLHATYPDIDVETIKKSLLLDRLVEKEDEGEDTETKIFEVAYSDEDPEKTQRVLEALKEVYLDYNLAQQDKRLQEGLSFIDKQIPEARETIDRAEAELKQLRTRYNLIAPDKEATTMAEMLNNIEQQRASISAEYQATKGRVDQLQGVFGLSANNADTASRLSQSSTYQLLFDRLQEIETQLAAERNRFTEDNPIVRELIERRDSTQTQLRQEAERILGTATPGSLPAILPQQQTVDSDTELIQTLTQAKADLAALSERDRALAKTEQKLRQQLNQFPDIIAQYANLAQDLQTKRDTLQRLLTAKQELGIEIDRGGFNWQIVEPPRLGEETGPSTTQKILICGIVATFLGGVAAFFREALDDRIYSYEQLQERIDLPILGTAPSLLPPADDPFTVKLPFLLSRSVEFDEIIHWPPFRESLDLIYENIQLIGYDSSYKSIAVTSPSEGEGKSTLVVGLAMSVARHHNRVLIIDGDLRCPTIHQKFRLDNQSGLSDFLIGQTIVPNINQVTLADERIDVLTSGAISSDPVKLLNSSKFKQLIRNYEEIYDLILIDTPPAIGMADAIKVASCCDGTILMTRLNQVKASELLQAVGLLDKLNVIGVIANDSKEVVKQYKNKKRYLFPETV